MTRQDDENALFTVEKGDIARRADEAIEFRARVGIRLGPPNATGDGTGSHSATF